MADQTYPKSGPPLPPKCLSLSLRQICNDGPTEMEFDFPFGQQERGRNQQGISTGPIEQQHRQL